MPENTTTLGTHQEVHIGKFRADRRGLISGSAQRHIEEGYADINFSLLRVDAAPSLPIPCVGVERDYVFPNGIYTYSYEGVADDSDDERLITFELDISMEEVGIEAHPNFEAIRAKYGPWDENRKRFTRKTLSVTVNSGPGLSGPSRTASQDMRNPLFGTDSYLVFGATFKKSYVRKAIPPSALRGIGTIISRPVGLSHFPLPAAAKYRQWLKVAPKITKRGNSVHIDENYLMSGRHGIVADIYGAAQLDEEDDNSTTT